MFPVRHETIARDGDARAGVATTHRGTYATPCFMPVGTRGAIKYLSAADYVEVGARTAQVCQLGNIGYWLRRPLKWNPDKEEFVGDAEANSLRSRPERNCWA